MRPRTALPSHTITVFLKTKKYDFNIATSKVNSRAFMPRQFNERFETSVFNINGLREIAVWKLGHLWTVINPIGRKSGQSNVKARGDLNVGAFLRLSAVSKLKLEVDPSPNPRHHNIFNWPTNEAEQELAALELANETELKLNPDV